MKVCNVFRVHNNYEHVLHSVRCDHPLAPDLPSDVVVSGYDDPAIVGTSFTINCPVTSEMNTTLTITCNDEGMWEPDLRLTKLCMGRGTFELVVSNKGIM